LAEESFGEAIRRSRKETGVSLRKLARMAEISPAYLSKLERGLLPPPSEEFINSISSALEVDSDWLLAKAGKVATDVIKAIVSDPAIINSIRGKV